MSQGHFLQGSVGPGKKGGKSFVDSLKMLEGKGLGRKREFMKDFPFYQGPRARKAPLCQKVGVPFWVGEGLCSVLQPAPWGAGQ